MHIYVNDIKDALFSFVVLSVILTIPYMLFQYIKYGSISKVRTLILTSFLLYLLCIYYLVILPLPNPNNLTYHGPIMQLMPFRFVSDFIAGTSFDIRDISTYLGLFKENVFMQPLFNVLLTLPLGIYLSYYFKQSFKKTILITFIVSLFFELTQLSGLYGIYERPYRLFDVDDLILNTLGGLIGLFIYKHFLSFLPTKAEIDEENLEQSKKVGYIRRLFALIIDYIVFSAIYIWVDFVIININNLYYLNTMLFIVYLLTLQLIFKNTVGNFLVHIKVALVSEQKYYLGLIKRYVILSMPLSLLLFTEVLVGANYIIYGELLGFLLFIGDFLYSFKREKCLFYERLSKTKFINTLNNKKVIENN